MKVDLKLLKLLRKKTKISIKECFEALKKTNNNIILSEELLLNINTNNILKNENKNYIIYTYNKKIISIMIKCKFESNFLFLFNEIIYLIKKIIYLLIKNKSKNIFYLKKEKEININNIIKRIIVKTKENFIIKKFTIIKYMKKTIIYNYENKISLTINYINYFVNFLTKNICIHIIISKPVYISLKSINIKKIKNKYKVLKIKNKNILLEKILNKILKKYTLINQKFVKNNKYKIKNILKKKKIIINKILYYK